MNLLFPILDVSQNTPPYPVDTDIWVSTSACATDEIPLVSVYSYLFAYFWFVSQCQQGLGNRPHNV